MKLFFAIIVSSFLVGCMSTGETQQANARGIVLQDNAGGFGDRGAAIASKHCAQYGKIAIYATRTQVGWGERISYLCQ